MSANETAMRSMLDRHPDALVAGVDHEGLFIELPASIPTTRQRVVAARSAIDLVQAADRYGVIDAWTRAKEDGIASTPVTLVGSPPTHAVLHLFDVNEDHGVFVAIVIADGFSSARLDEVAEIAAPSPRLARSRKNEIAILTHADETVTSMLGWQPEEMVGKSSLEFIHPDDHQRAINMWMECLTQPGYTCRTRVRHQHRDGRWIWLELANRNLLDDPDAGYVDCEMFDISEEMEAHEAVRASEQLLRRLAEALPVGVAQFDLDQEILYANDRFYEIFGTDHTADAATLRNRFVDSESMQEALARLFRGEDVDTEVRINRLDDGTRVRCALALRALTDAGGAVVGGVLSLADITDSARMRSELEARATYDVLTGCVNRPTVMAMLGQMLDHLPDGGDGDGAAASPGLAVVFVDLDRFKAVNDDHGHAVGDAFLATIAARLREVVRGADVVGRLGGDEFLLVCPSVSDLDDALAVGERVIAAVHRELQIGSVELVPSASVGVAWIANRSLVDAQDLISAADAAMYAAKENQDGRPIIVDCGRDSAVRSVDSPRSTRTIDDDLRLALTHDELEVHFQPIVRIDTAQVVGHEALLRWRHDGRLAPAAEFIATAEATDVICEIGPWVIDEVCCRIAAARDAALTWTVNLSPRELSAPRTIMAFDRAFDRHGVEPSSVVVEIAGFARLSADGAASRTIGNLVARGVGIAVDDFGTSSSSLLDLVSGPLRWLKIDRQLTAHAATDRGAAIIDGVVRIADRIGAMTVAEGVETAGERDAVRSLGVEVAQGHLFGPARPLT